MICKYSNLRIEFWYSRSVLHLRWHECRKKNWSIVLACKIFSHIRPKIQTLFPVVFVNIYAWLIAFGEEGPCLNLFKLWMNFMMFYLRTFQQPKWITMGTLSVLMDHSVFQNKTCSKGRIVENQNDNIYFFWENLIDWYIPVVVIAFIMRCVLKCGSHIIRIRSNKQRWIRWGLSTCQ